MTAFEDHYWNSMQLLAWVWLRDKQAVEVAADDAPSRSYCREETLPDGRVECIETPSEPLCPISLTIMAAMNGAALPDQRAAEIVVINELIAGQLDCLGLRNGQGDPEKVPASNWLQLQLKWWRNELAAVSKDLLRRGSTSWRELKFQREQVLSTDSTNSVLVAGSIPQGKPRRHGGRKPGQYMERLRQFLEHYHKTQPGGLNGVPLASLTADARSRLSRDNVRNVPVSRQLEESVKKIRAEILQRDLQEIRR